MHDSDIYRLKGTYKHKGSTLGNTDTGLFDLLGTAYTIDDINGTPATRDDNMHEGGDIGR